MGEFLVFLLILVVVGLITVVPVWILVKLYKVSRQQDDSFDRLSLLSGKVEQLLDGQQKLRDRLVAGVGKPSQKEELPPEPEPVVEAEVVSAPVPPMPPAEPVAAYTAARPFETPLRGSSG